MEADRRIGIIGNCFIEAHRNRPIGIGPTQDPDTEFGGAPDQVLLQNPLGPLQRQFLFGEYIIFYLTSCNCLGLREACARVCLREVCAACARLARGRLLARGLREDKDNFTQVARGSACARLARQLSLRDGARLARCLRGASETCLRKASAIAIFR